LLCNNKILKRRLENERCREGGREGAQELLLYYKQKNRLLKDGAGLRQALKAFKQALQGI